MSPERRAANAATMRRYRARLRGELPPWRPLARDLVAAVVAVSNEAGEVCLEWVRAHNGKGYGIVRHRGRLQVASRVALERKLGRELLPGMRACHTCDNPPCIRPAHLFEGTVLENTADMVSKGRASWQSDGRSFAEQAVARYSKR